MSDKKYFAETVRFLEVEREEAKTYLTLWKKYLIRNLYRDTHDLKIIDEEWIERPAYIDGALAQLERMSLKLCIEAKWKYELT